MPGQPSAATLSVAQGILFRRATGVLTGLGMLALAVSLALPAAIWTRSPDGPRKPLSGPRNRMLGTYGKLPLSFVGNAGQTDRRVGYQAQAPGVGVYFTKKKAVLSFAKGKRGLALALGFEGANPKTSLAASAELPGRVSYLRGDEPAKWQIGLRTYGEVRYRELWPGIDMVVRGSGGRLKYEFHVRPGARPSDIRLTYKGAERLALGAGGSLLVNTPLGALRDARPVSYQTIGGRRVPVASRYRLHDPKKNAYGFSVGASYEPRHPLVIDPVLAYSTFLGGGDTDAGFDVAVDGAGSAYVTGYTYSTDFPTTTGVYDTTSNGNADAYVTKLDPAGSLSYSTYLGGGGDEFGNGIAVDGAGSAYLTGDTSSDDFPTTAGAYDTTPDSSPALLDAFVTKLDPSGSGLSYSTYLGGESSDRAYDLVTDEAGNAYVAGGTGSTAGIPNDFPTTAGAYDTTPSANGDAFATKLNPSGSALSYSTYLGGESSEASFGVAVDAAGSAYLTGNTLSPDFPTTAGAYDTSFSGGAQDGFVSKLNPAGSGLSYSTYLGGGTTDVPEGIAVDSAGSAYVAGDTFSSDFPTTTGAYDTTISADTFDAFVTKLNASGSALSYSTFLGGNNSDLLGDIAVDAGGSAHVTGYTLSSDFPTTPGAYDTSFSGDDAFVTRLNPPGSGLSYSTSLGGGASEVANGIGLDAGGNVYIAGLTSSSDFPTTAGAHDTTFNGGSFDAFATKLDLSAIPPSTPNCTTSNIGLIIAANGDRARFLGRAETSASGEPSGSETYADRGPADRIAMRSTSIDALVCAGRDATVFGRALVNGEELSFRIDLHDGGGRRRDSFRVQLSDGHDSGTQPLRSGHVRVR